MLAAFLCDIEILKASRGKASLDTVLSRLYSTHSLSAIRMNGNEAILGIMAERAELGPIVGSYIRGNEPVDVTKDLSDTGIAVGGRISRLSVKEKLSSREKAILDKLGYNNWRKLAGK